MNRMTSGITPRLAAAGLFLMAALWGAAPAAADVEEDRTYTKNEVLDAAINFFGETSEGLAEVVEKAFEEQGQPSAYITGEEVGGAIGVGLRYGTGRLHLKGGGPQEIYWQGPSVGFDFGGNAAKVFILVYNLAGNDALFRRFPSVEGSIYFVAGVGMNYLQSDDIVLAPIRTGVGYRAGVNVGYLHFTREKSWNPF